MNLYLKYLHFILKNNWLLAIGIILVLVAGLPGLHPQVANNLEDWYPENSSKLVDKKQFVKDFGNDEMMYLLLTFQDTATEAFRKNTVTKLADSLSGIYGLEQVLIRYQLQTEKPMLFMGIKQRLKKLEHLFFPILDPNCEMLYMKTRLTDNFDTSRPALIDSVKTIIAQIPISIRADLSGSGVIFNEMNQLRNEETSLLFVVCFVVVLTILAWRLKNIKRLGFALLLFLLLFWPAWSLFGWLNLSMNMITMIVPILLIINFFAYILHLMEKSTPDLDEHVKAKLPPIVFSGITTMIGFGSLMMSDMKVIYQFGLLTFSGVLVGLLVLVVVGVPMVIRMRMSESLPNLQPLDVSTESKLKKFSLLTMLDTLSPKKASYISLAALFIFLGGLFVFYLIKIDTNSLHYLPADNPVRIASGYIEAHFGTYNTVDYIISNNDQESLNMEDLKVIKTISDSLEQLDFVSGAVTYGLWKPLLTWIASEDKVIAQQISSNYFTKDKKTTRMSLRIPMGSVNEMRNYMQTIDGEIHQINKGQALSIRAVGYLPIYLEQIDQVVSGMLKSLSLALIFITLCMILMVGNLKLGLLALIPNTFPLGGVALFMFFNDMPLDIGVSLIASIIIGLVVDDTLHIIWAYKSEMNKGHQLSFSFSKMFRPILKPSTTTSIIFTSGFLVLAMSELRSVHDFGVLISLAIVLGWIGDFIVFPAVLRLPLIQSWISRGTKNIEDNSED